MIIIGINELIFFVHVFAVTLCSLGALWLGRSALITLMALLVMLSNLFVTKEIMLFGLTATPTDALTIGSVFCFNLLQEYFDQKAVVKGLIISFAGSICCTLLSQLHLLYLPTLYDVNHMPAALIFGFLPRVVAASLITYLIAQYSDMNLFSFLKKRYGSDHFIIRNNGCALFSQLIDTILFSFLALYGTFHSLGSVILVSYSLKVCALLLATPLFYLSKHIMKYKRHEQLSL